MIFFTYLRLGSIAMLAALGNAILSVVEPKALKPPPSPEEWQMSPSEGYSFSNYTGYKSDSTLRHEDQVGE
jgi:hypothetical protein